MIAGRPQIESPQHSNFYMLIFGSQTELNLPQHSHVFALFVRSTTNDQVPEQGVLETHVISWLPAAGSVDPVLIEPVPGKNFNLEETLEAMHALNARVTVWGPFRVRKVLYDMAVVQEQRLNAKAIRYLMIDVARRGHDASNCIHAVCDIDTIQPPLVTGTSYGDAASQLVCAHLKQYILPQEGGAEWLEDRLGLRSRPLRFASEGTRRLDVDSREEPIEMRKSRLSARLRAYVADYGGSHQTATNKVFHFVGIPVLMISAVGLLAKISLSADDPHSLWQPNAAWIFLAVAAIWYTFLDAITSIVLCSMFIASYIIGGSAPTWLLGAGLGFGAIAHVIGHQVFEQKPPSLLKKPISLLVAPAWLLEKMGY